MTNPAASIPIHRLWNSKPPLELIKSQSKSIHPFIDVDGNRTRVSSAVLDWNRLDLHNWLLERNEPTTPFASVALYCYRVNFGGDPPRFTEFVASRPNDHIWKVEYAVANLAWTIPRINRSLDLIRINDCDASDEIIDCLSPIMSGMDKFETLSDVGGMDFFSTLPVELISWPQVQLETIHFTPQHNHKSQSWFHSERHLRFLVNELGKRVQSDLTEEERELLRLTDEASREDSPLRGQMSKWIPRQGAKLEQMDRGFDE